MKNDFNSSLIGKKILFTVWYADGFHGAVIHISEIAEYLINQGAEIYCACAILSNDTKNYFISKGIKVYTLDNIDYSLEYDIIWNIHFPIFPFLLKNNIKYKKVISNCLSPFLEVESPPVFYDAYSMILAVSNETKDKIVNYYKVPSDKVKILNNVIPLNYFLQQKTCRTTVKKVVIVSNHVPQELLDSVCLFKERGIECDIIGKKYNYVPINPEILSQYDVIITIGKTVQYSLALNIPCYCYDYFGGSGYITENNIDKESYYNFSGRSFETKKTALEIVTEVIDGYNNSLQNTEKLKEIAKNKYSVSSQLEPIIDYVMNSPIINIDINKYALLIDQYYFLISSIKYYYSKMKRINKKYKAKSKKSFIKKLFSINNEYYNNSKHKVICIFGIKSKFIVKEKNRN